MCESVLNRMKSVYTSIQNLIVTQICCILIANKWLKTIRRAFYPKPRAVVLLSSEPREASEKLNYALAARLSRARPHFSSSCSHSTVSQKKIRDRSQSNFVLCPKQGNKFEGVVLNRVCILGFFRPKQAGRGLRPIPKYWSSTPSPPGVTGKFKIRYDK